MRNHKPVFAWLICSLGALFYCYEYLLRIVPSVMAVPLMRAFHIDATALGKLAAFYYLAYVPMQLPVGILTDRYGPKKLLVISSLICALGCVLVADSSLSAAQLGRLLTGFGSAFAFVCVMKLATLWLPPSRFALAVGLVMSVSMLGVVGGNIILSKLLNLLSWPPVMYFLGFIGIIIAGLIGFIVPDKNNGSNEKTPGSLIAGFKQLRTELTQLFKKPQLWLIGIAGCLLYLPISMFAELWATPYLMRVYNFPNELSAKIAAMIFMGMAIGSPVIGLISDYIKRRIILMFISSVMATVVAITIIYYPALNVTQLYWLFFLLGLFTSGQTLIFSFARVLTNLSIAGTAIALVNTIVMIGGMLFQPLIGYLLDLVTDSKITGRLSTYSAQDFQYVMLVLPIGIFIGALIICLLREPGDNSSFQEEVSEKI